MRGTSKANGIVAMTFLVILFLPMIGLFSPATRDYPEIHEERVDFAAPLMNFKHLSDFPKHAEYVFNDHFGFRNSLIALNNYLKLKVFNVSGTQGIIPGKDKWLFFNGFENLDDGLGINQLSPYQLSLMRTYLVAKNNWLASKGVKYQFIIVPDKSSIYSEKIPDFFKRMEGKSSAETFVDYMAIHSSVRPLFLKNGLLEKKTDGRLFLLYDTHWNEQGAFFSVQLLLEELHRKYGFPPPYKTKEIEETTKVGRYFDIAQMLGLGEYYSETIKGITIKPSRSRDGHFYKYGNVVLSSNDESLPKVVMFCDSFSVSMVPYLRGKFSHLRLVWEPWSKKMYWNSSTEISQILINDQPDIILEETAEFFLKYLDDSEFRQPISNREFPSIFSMAFTDKVFSLDRQSGAAIEIQPLYQTELEKIGAGLRVRSLGDDPQLMLSVPESSSIAGSDKLLHVVVESPVDTALSFFYKTEEMPFHNVRNSWRIEIGKGENTILIPILEKNVFGDFRLDPGSAPGNYLIKKLELRERFRDFKPEVDEEGIDLTIDQSLGLDQGLNANDFSRPVLNKLFSRFPREIFNIDNGAGRLTSLQQIKHISAPAAGGRIEFLASGDDPSLELPEIDGAYGESMLFQCDITSPADTVFQLFYQTKAKPYYNIENSYTVAIRKGDNRILIPIVRPEMKGRIRIDPGAYEGYYQIENMSLRSSSNSINRN